MFKKKIAVLVIAMLMGLTACGQESTKEDKSSDKNTKTESSEKTEGNNDNSDKETDKKQNNIHEDEDDNKDEKVLKKRTVQFSKVDKTLTKVDLFEFLDYDGEWKINDYRRFSCEQVEYYDESGNIYFLVVPLKHPWEPESEIEGFSYISFKTGEDGKPVPVSEGDYFFDDDDDDVLDDEKTALELIDLFKSDDEQFIDKLIDYTESEEYEDDESDDAAILDNQESYDPAGNLVRKTELKKDYKGNEGDERKLESVTEYEYWDSGNLKKETLTVTDIIQENNPQLIETRIKEYDEDGIIVSERINSTTEILYVNGKRSVKNTYYKDGDFKEDALLYQEKYLYDKDGNLTTIEIGTNERVGLKEEYTYEYWD